MFVNPLALERIREVRELGIHVLVELYDCNPVIVNDMDAVRKHMIEAAKRTGSTVVGEVFHQFSPQGVSGTVVIAESHLAVHTWPELGYCALDLYTCGDHVDPLKGFRYLLKALGAKRYCARSLKRGIHSEAESDTDSNFLIRAIGGKTKLEELRRNPAEHPY
ncbi:MAG: hypothetical protein Kow0090_08540 [Myxococcota bacterium]